MACRDVYKVKTLSDGTQVAVRADAVQKTGKITANRVIRRLLFGVDSLCRANELLQNNLTMFEWVVRNKIYPNFWGRALNGPDGLTTEEIKFLHSKGCKIAAIYTADEMKNTAAQGMHCGELAGVVAMRLGIPVGKAIFVDIDQNEDVTTDFLFAYAKTLLEMGYSPGVRANTDAQFVFDREFSRGMRMERGVFEKILVWATAPTYEEYDRMTTSHLIHPDCWKPYAPSGISRNEIAVWCYGKECHPIFSDVDRESKFNINLLMNDRVIIEKMF